MESGKEYFNSTSGVLNEDDVNDSPSSCVFHMLKHLMDLDERWTKEIWGIFHYMLIN
jgi:hypothetical protein